MIISSKVTATFIGPLGAAVQHALLQESVFPIDTHQDLTWLTNMKTELLPPQEEEVLLLVTKLENLSSEDLTQLKERQPNIFTIVVALAPASPIKQIEALQQELLTTVDSMIVLPASEEDSAFTSHASVHAISQTVKYLTALIQAAWDGEVNVDFEDVKTVIRSKSPTSVSIAKASGKNRVAEITKQLFSSPYMVQGQAQNASRLLLQILSSRKAELEMDELTEITDAIQDACGEESEIIFGHSLEDDLAHEIEVFLLATP